MAVPFYISKPDYVEIARPIDDTLEDPDIRFGKDYG